MSGPDGIDRRTFFGLVGGGVVVFVTLGPGAVFSQQRRRLYPEDLNAYLLIGSDGRVTVFSGKIEMGQGVMTSQAQMVAEELRVALDAVEMVMGDTDRCPWDMGTFGSLTTRMFGPYLRAAAAEARSVLLGLAAKRLDVPRDRLRVADGVVRVVDDPERKVGYGELARGRKIARTVEAEAVLRKVGEFTVMGLSPERLDAHDKVTGGARYAADIRRDGMLYARVLRPPAHGARLVRLDTAAAAKTPGVRMVTEGDLVAVLHRDPETAAAALAKIDAAWDVPKPAFDSDTVFDHLVRAAPPPDSALDRGDLATARAAAARSFTSTFRKGYVAHAPMEPHTAVAELEDGRLTIWASTQTPFPTRDRIAEAVGLPVERVRLITPYVGGGFGGKSAGGQALEAARLALAVKAPVQVAWTRGEEFFYDTFDPAAVVRLESGIDGAGRITLWDYHVFSAGGRGADLFYDVPNARIRVSGAWRGAGTEIHPFAVGPWRAPGANMNVFAMESQIDLMAAAAGLDPLELPPAQYLRPAHASGARGGGEGIRLEARRLPHRPRARAGLRHRRRELRRAGRGGHREPLHRRGHGGPGRRRPGDGRRRQPRRGDDADGRLRRDGPRLRAERGAAIRGRRRDGPQLRQLRAAPVLVAPRDRDGDRTQRRARAAGRRRAGDRPDGRGHRQRDLRRDRGPPGPASDHPDAAACRAREARHGIDGDVLSRRDAHERSAMRRCDGSRVMITGASSGIGAALATELARRGARVALLARRADRLEQIAERIRSAGGTALPVVADVTRDGDLEAAVAKTVDAFGGLDLAIANAGFGVGGYLARLDLGDYRRQFETNVFGVLRTVYAAVPALRESRGTLVLMGSVAGHLAAPRNSAYAMSKFAVRALASCLQGELEPFGLRVVLVSPGFVESEIRLLDTHGRMQAGAKEPLPRWLPMPTDRAARSIASGILRGTREVVVTGHGKIGVFFSRHFPRLTGYLLRRSARPSAARAKG